MRAQYTEMDLYYMAVAVPFATGLLGYMIGSGELPHPFFLVLCGLIVAPIFIQGLREALWPRRAFSFLLQFVPSRLRKRPRQCHR
jgi:hypothetical protein